MTSRDFCYWLQGYFEILGANNPTPEQQALTPAQTDMIGRHLALVFKHEIDPSIDKGDPDLKKAFDELHGARPPVAMPPLPSQGTPFPTQLRC